jgi:hypothetical protein
MENEASKNLTEAVSPLLDAAGSPAAAGVVIGPYPTAAVGWEGGIGQVWLVHRRGALKLIKVGMDTREVVARFGEIKGHDTYTVKCRDRKLCLYLLFDRAHAIRQRCASLCRVDRSLPLSRARAVRTRRPRFFS